MPTFFFPRKPNARCELLLEAGARHERTLFAVACKPLFGAGSGKGVAFPSPPPDSGASPRLWWDWSPSYPSLEQRLYPSGCMR